jgi:hypothetical protein
MTTPHGWVGVGGEDYALPVDDVPEMTASQQLSHGTRRRDHPRRVYRIRVARGATATPRSGVFVAP